MVGDVVHNARSALDQAAWLLACRSNPVEELWEPSIAWKISFPITRDPGRFKTHRVLPFLHEDAIALLEGLQPYNGGATAQSIDHLDHLWNIDKHRVIHSSTIKLDISKVSFRPRAVFAERDLIEHPRSPLGASPPTALKTAQRSPVSVFTKAWVRRIRMWR